MRNDFLRELDRWLLALLRRKICATDGETDQVPVTATEFAQMISDYVLLRLADGPDTCWCGCGLDETSDAAILGTTTFSEELLAAGFIGAVCELGRWHGPNGIAFMTAHGVPPDDAQAIASGVEVVCAKLGARGQALIQRPTAGSGAWQPQPDTPPGRDQPAAAS